MKQNNQSINTPIMLDYIDSSNQSNLLQYETHIRLVYKYSIAAFAGNVKLKDFMQARRHFYNTYSTDIPKDTLKKFLETERLLLQEALLRPTNEIGDKIPVGGFIGRESLALNFAKDYEVIDHINEKDRESRGGFRATLFRHINNKEYVLALAGTDFVLNRDFGFTDIATDGSLLFRKLPKFQYDSMINFYFRLKQNSCITKDTPLVVVGHSLGGYLAQLFALTYPHIIKGLYTYQAPGSKRLWRGLFTLLQSLHIKAKETETNSKQHRKQAYINLSKSHRQEAMNILKDKTFHIHTDNDSNLNNNQWILANFVQELGTKTPGYLYYINDKNNDFHYPAHCVRALERLDRLLDRIHNNAKKQMNLQDMNVFLRNLYHYALLHRRGETLSEAIDCVLSDVAYYHNLIESKSIDFLQDMGLEAFMENKQIYIMPLSTNDFINIPLDSLNKLDLGYLRPLVKSQAYRLIAENQNSLLNSKNIAYFLGYNTSTYKIYQNGLDDFSFNAYRDRFHFCIEQGEIQKVIFKEDMYL
ncbi:MULTISPECIES: S28 family serine protease [Helicobacter]|uniref:DUF2974 domain-containing protein n=1 Tax=Helicobacter bilis ATCC 43879 TaxID=613026 RepID=C3XIP5_9HELI|nr:MULTISPECIES: S28 family serine protease [Helicobacter]EEO24884.1 hypothetical protein HRAG_01941 [Helicobacter bilis ATCC 43879]